jgi:DNA-binding CsgD family transcriptional regulator/tetratricopeptide (TPR) repeat protein
MTTNLWQTRRRRERPVIYGRERERARLRHLLDAAVASEGSLALVSGEAGIGKSTIIDDLIHEATRRGCLVLSGGCYDLATTPPYGPWVEIIRAYPSDENLPPLPNELRSGTGLATIVSQSALFELAANFFADVARVRPLVLLLEDIHWADHASLDLLRYLARSISDVPTLVIASYRDDEISSDHALFALLPALARESPASRLDLQRLTTADTLQLVRERYRLPSDDETRLVSYMNRLAEGNPFFMVELLHTLEEQGILRPAAGGWRLGDLTLSGVPSLVQQVIARRLSPLTAPARITLDMASVFGPDIRLDILHELLRETSLDLDDALQEALDSHLLVLQPHSGAIRFCHALVRQTVYDAISPVRRQSLHRGIAELLADRVRPDPDAVASHFFHASDERALSWLVRAAERAHAVFAPEAVVTRCDQAIELAVRLQAHPPATIYRLRGLALETMGDFVGARESHETGLELARDQNDRELEGEVLLDLAMLWASRDYSRSGDYCRLAVDVARTMNVPAALGHSLNRLGNWHINVTGPADGLRYHEEALGIFEATGDKRGLASTLDLIAMSHMMKGDTATALDYYSRAIPLLREIDDRQTLVTAIATSAAATGGFSSMRVSCIPMRPSSAESHVDTMLAEAVQISRSIGWQAGECFALGFQALYDIVRGDLSHGMQRLVEHQAIAERIEHRQWRIFAESTLGVVFADLMLPDRARLHLGRAVELADLVASKHMYAQSIGQLSSSCVRAGDLDEADRLLRDHVHLDHLPDTVSVRGCWYAFAELALARENPPLALRTIDGLIQAIGSSPGYPSPDIGRLRGAILFACGLHDEAEQQLMEARAIADTFGYQLILWRIHATLRKLYLAQGRLGEADAAGDAALGIIDDLAGQLDDEDLRAAFLRGARAEVPPRPPYSPSRSVQTAFGGLTRREIEVLRLVAQGLSDADVAESLFISRRTVGQHLRSIYAKLGVTNRTAATRIAVDHGLS